MCARRSLGSFLFFSEWRLFEEMCASGEPLPFDQLFIELHGCEEKLLASLIACLDTHGIYPFSREENPHQQLCGKQPSLGFGDVEMAFVRAQSRFTLPPVAASLSAEPAAPAADTEASSLMTQSSHIRPNPLGDLLAADTAAQRQQALAQMGGAAQRSAAAAAAASTAPPSRRLARRLATRPRASQAANASAMAAAKRVPPKRPPSRRRRRLSAPLAHAQAAALAPVDVRALMGFSGRGPKLFMVDWNAHVRQWRESLAPSGTTVGTTDGKTDGTAGGTAGGAAGPKHSVVERSEVAREMRKAWVHLGGATHAEGFGAGWAHMEMGRCRDSPAYLLDLFEPRGWCLEKRGARGFHFQPLGDSEGHSSESGGGGQGARALCLPEARYGHAHSRHGKHGGGGGGGAPRACAVTPALGAAPIPYVDPAAGAAPLPLPNPTTTPPLLEQRPAPCTAC
jgi:hypothetical protein